MRVGLEGGLWGGFLGDAHAMPSHWYYSVDVLKKHFPPSVSDRFLCSDDVRQPHPDSWKYYKNIDCAQSPWDIFQGLGDHYTNEGGSYHQLLQRGENTLNAKLALVLLQTVLESSEKDANGKWIARYNMGEYVGRYLEMFLTPGTHLDTFISTSHRSFFLNLYSTMQALPYETPLHVSIGEAINRKCPNWESDAEDCLAGLVTSLPLVFFWHSNLEDAKRLIQQQMCITHPNKNLAIANSVLAELIAGLIQLPVPRTDPKVIHKAKELIKKCIVEINNPESKKSGEVQHMGSEIEALLEEDDEEVVLGKFSGILGSSPTR